MPKENGKQKNINRENTFYTAKTYDGIELSQQNEGDRRRHRQSENEQDYCSCQTILRKDRNTYIIINQTITSETAEKEEKATTMEEPRPAPGHQDGQNYYYIVVEDGNGGVDIVAGQPHDDLGGTVVPANVASSTNSRAPYNFVVWTAILLFVVAALFGLLHCYWRRLVASDANTVAAVSYSGSSRRHRRGPQDDEDEDEERKQKREEKKRSYLLDDMKTRKMIWTVSNITTTKKIHDNNNNNNDHNDDSRDAECGDLETGTITNETPVIDEPSTSCSSTTSDCDINKDVDSNSQHAQKLLMFSDSATTSMVCAICLDDYEEGDEVVRSCHPDCDHIFHLDCVLDTFVKQKKRNDQGRTTDDKDTKYPCPICRRPHFFNDHQSTNSNTTDVSKDGEDDNDCEESATTIIDESTVEDDISEVEDDNGGGGDTSSTTSRNITAENDDSFLNVYSSLSGGQNRHDGSQNQQPRQNDDIEEGIIES